MQTPTSMPARSADMIDLEGNSNGSPLSLTTTAAQTAALTAGVYDIWSDVDCYIKIGTTANDVTTSGYLLRANVTLPNVLIRKDRKIGGIVASGTGTLGFHKIG